MFVNMATVFSHLIVQPSLVQMVYYKVVVLTDLDIDGHYTEVAKAFQMNTFNLLPFKTLRRRILSDFVFHSYPCL